MDIGSVISGALVVATLGGIGYIYWSVERARREANKGLQGKPKAKRKSTRKAKPEAARQIDTAKVPRPNGRDDPEMIAKTEIRHE